MDLGDARRRLEEAEALLSARLLAPFADFATPHGKLRVLVSERLRRRCRKGKVWKTPAMLATLRNASYGFDENAPRSRGGADGVFLVDRRFRPVNSMMTKLFARFLDKPDPLVSVVAGDLGVAPSMWTPVRVVSHHMRLLGVFARTADGTAHVVLVDYDDEKDV